MLLDVWMPRMNGLELLEQLRTLEHRPRVVVMTSDETPATLLQAVRDQAFTYVHKPVDAEFLIETVRLAIAAPETRPIEVISARPEWVELILPCTREAANRLQSFMAHLDTDLPAELRDSIAYAFRGLLLNAVEWGGKLDPKHTVRISLSARQADGDVASSIPAPASTSTIFPTRRSAIRIRRPPIWTCAMPRGFAPADSAC